MGLAVQADVSQPEDIARMFSEVQSTLGGLDIFVSRTLRPDLPGFYGHRPLEITLEQWDVALMTLRPGAFLVAA